MYYRQMEQIKFGLKRELNPFWIFLPRFFTKGDVYLWAVLSLREITGYFLACSLGTAWIQGRSPPAVQVKSFTKWGQQRRLARTSLWKPERMDSHLGWGLAFFTSGSFPVLVGCPRNGHRLCHCAGNIVLSFMLLLLLFNYDMWLLFFFYYFFVWML